MSNTIAAARVGMMSLALWCCHTLPVAGGEPLREGIFGLPRPVLETPGQLVICGGGDLPQAVLDEFVRLAGGREGRLVLIPSAHAYESAEAAQKARASWLDYGLRSIDVIHTDEPTDADGEDFGRALEAATAVWFGGGDQGRLADRYVGRRIERLVHRVLEQGGVVGGTSAGAAIMSEVMIRYGSPQEAVVGRGLALTTRLVIDQHFTQRKRMPRLLGVLRDHPEQIGLGVDERTAVIVRGNELRVMGRGQATVFFGPRQTDGTPQHIVRLVPEDRGEMQLIGQGENAAEIQFVQHAAD